MPLASTDFDGVFPIFLQVDVHLELKKVRYKQFICSTYACTFIYTSTDVTIIGQMYAQICYTRHQWYFIIFDQFLVHFDSVLGWWRFKPLRSDHGLLQFGSGCHHLRGSLCREFIGIPGLLDLFGAYIYMLGLVVWNLHEDQTTQHINICIIYKIYMSIYIC